MKNTWKSTAIFAVFLNLLTILRTKYNNFDVSYWSDIVAIISFDINYDGFAVGVKSDGRVVDSLSIYNKWHDFAEEWKLFDSIDTLENKIIQTKGRRKVEVEGYISSEKGNGTASTNDLNVQNKQGERLHEMQEIRERNGRKAWCFAAPC